VKVQRHQHPIRAVFAEDRSTIRRGAPTSVSLGRNCRAAPRSAMQLVALRIGNRSCFGHSHSPPVTETKSTLPSFLFAVARGTGAKRDSGAV
jgi:hypothetical protein